MNDDDKKYETAIFHELDVTFHPNDAKHTAYKLADARVRLEPYMNEGEKFERFILHVSGLVMKAEHVKPEAESASVAGSSPSLPPTGPEEQSSTMYDLFEKWKGCTKCTLCENRQQVVFGSGNDIAPKFLVIGEAPGPEEERMGVPFIGPTGSVLRNALARLGVDPDRDGYITNSVICFPRVSADLDQFRGPTGVEMLACRERMSEQFVQLMSGGALRGILLVGKRAHISFFHREALKAGKYAKESDFEKFKLKDVLGWWSGPLPPDWGDVKVMTIYHPSYLKRQNFAESNPEYVAWKKDLETFVAWSMHSKFQNSRVI